MSASKRALMSSGRSACIRWPKLTVAQRREAADRPTSLAQLSSVCDTARRSLSSLIPDKIATACKDLTMQPASRQCAMFRK